MTKRKINLEKKTKIVATIGTVSQQYDILKKMIESGVNVARMNMSHGDHAEHGAKIDSVRKINEELGTYTAILFDLAGPKIRIGDFSTEKVRLIEGEKIILTTEKIIGNEKKVSVNYEKLPQELKKGNFVMINDGKQKLIVEKVVGNEITCKIIVGGEIKSRRGLNLPGAYLSIPALTVKDKKDLEFGLTKKVELIAISFVRTRKDIIDLRKILNKHPIFKNEKELVIMPKIIAKIETEEAIENFDDILEEVDGIMIARGDLAVEVPREKVPALQKMMIRKANEAGKLVITATQMLSSMQFSPVPSRAEVSDVANAIYDGSDAVMLSEESAIGEYPIETVKTMAEIAIATDSIEDPRHEYIHFDKNVDSIKKAAVDLAKTMNAKAIIALTETGKTAFKISRFRSNIPIIALTDKPEHMKFLSLAHGVEVISIKQITDLKQLRQTIKEVCKENNIAKAGERVVVVSGFSFGTPGSSNMLFVEEI